MCAHKNRKVRVIMNTQQIIETAEEKLIHTYNRYQIVLDKGDGVRLNDTDGKEYLDFVCGLYNQRERCTDLISDYITNLKLENSLDMTIQTYSLGMKQKIYLIGALISNAQNIILDEPFNGLDPESVAVLKRILLSFKDKGKMILFSAHNLDLVSNFCDKVIFIDRNHRFLEHSNPQNFNMLEQLFFESCVNG